MQELPRATGPMSREEVSALGSARREEVRRQIEISERLKANPLLYLVSPQVKVRFSLLIYKKNNQTNKGEWKNAILLKSSINLYSTKYIFLFSTLICWQNILFCTSFDLIS